MIVQVARDPPTVVGQQRPARIFAGAGEFQCDACPRCQVGRTLDLRRGEALAVGAPGDAQDAPELGVRAQRNGHRGAGNAIVRDEEWVALAGVQLRLRVRRRIIQHSSGERGGRIHDRSSQRPFVLSRSGGDSQPAIIGIRDERP